MPLTPHDPSGWCNPIRPEDQLDFQAVLTDFSDYQGLLDAGRVRSFMADQLHENIRFLLSLLDAQHFGK